ncbi:hypothetical protein WSM22_26460 [Cytophagales bacterium WSM2-2]|nr:hypothetical protein WSM22_26460 [Cytophagales bacterium WSM2-2]
MILNQREIILITYSTERNWASELPKSNWLCILVDNNRSQNYLNEVISKIINNDACWVSTVGQACEKNHDMVDDEIQFRQVDIENLYLPKHDIMTTWYEDFNEGIWFSIFAANDDGVSIDKVVILDMTDGQEKNRIERLLEGFKCSFGNGENKE